MSGTETGGGLVPGSRLGDYEILAELGAGGMGRVYHAKDLTLERMVAVKTLAPQHKGNQMLVDRFLKEARAAARLNHPNIVQIYDFGVEGDLYYLAMEFVDGESVARKLRGGPLSEAEAIRITRLAARALGVAHAAGLVHRDVKPDNLMLTRDGDLKLVDLGVAKLINDDQSLTQTGQAIGTPWYISPEQIRAAKDIDGRADIYSLGATLYHLVTGQPPFRGETSALVMSMHLFQPVEDPRTLVPGLSEGIVRVLQKMVAKSPGDRYPDAGSVDRDLARLEGGAPVELAKTPAPVTPVGLASGGQPVASEATLKLVEAELAKHVGPLARVLVKRAAKSATSLRQLVGQLEGEIAEEKQRAAFRNAVARLR